MPFQGAEWFGWGEFPGRWPGLMSGCTFGARVVMEMTQNTAEQGRCRQGAGTLLLHVRLNPRVVVALRDPRDVVLSRDFLGA